MAIDYETGELVWHPTIADIGVQTVDVVVKDPSGASATLPVSILVRAANSPPIVRGFAPPLVARVGESYQVIAYDVDNGPEPLFYEVTLTNQSAPNGISIDNNGLLEFASSVSRQELELRVSDGDLDVVLPFSVEIAADGANIPPRFATFPPVRALDGLNGPIYTSLAIDPDGDDGLIVYGMETEQDQDGFTFAEGVLSWDTTGLLVGSSYEVVLTASDGEDVTYLRSQILLEPARANPNEPPEIVAPGEASPLAAQVGARFQVAIVANDNDGDRIFYRIESGDGTPLPDTMQIDRNGILSWDATDAVVGDSHRVTVIVVDEFGEFDPDEGSKTYTINVENDATLSLTASETSVFRRQRVTFAVGTSNATAFDSVRLEISNSAGTESVSISSQLLANYVFENPGTYQVTAYGSPVEGGAEVRSNDVTVTAYDEQSFSAELELYEQGFTDVRQTLADPTTLNYRVEFPVVYDGNSWELTLVSSALGELDSGIVLAEGEGSVSLSSIDFDPRNYQEGDYELRLRAIVNSPHERFFQDQYHPVYLENPARPADGTAIGNFGLSFTDLSVPVGGIPVTIQRTYDSERANEQSDFGFGWRLELRDTKFHTTGTKVYDRQESDLPNFVPDQTLLRITLPGGQRESFLFRVSASGLSQFERYEPYFIPRPGTTSSLRVVADPTYLGTTQLTRSSLYTSELVLTSAADPLLLYNPARLRQSFVLTTADQMEFWIDSRTGEIYKIADPTGNFLEFEDTRITSYSPGDEPGEGSVRTAEVRFETQGPNGSISKIFDPDGTPIVYEYDPVTKDLISVTNRESETVRFEYNIDQFDNAVFATSRPHLLTRIVDNRDVRVLQAQFEQLEQGVLLTGIEDARGNEAGFGYTFDQEIDGVTHSVEKITTELGSESEIVRDLRGNTVRTIQYDADAPLDKAYSVTVITYDENDFLTGTSKVLSTSLDNRFDLAGLAPDPDVPSDWLSRAEYDEMGNVIQQIDSDGLSTSYLGYNIFGSPAQIHDKTGTVTTNSINDGAILPVKTNRLYAVGVEDSLGRILSGSNFQYHDYTGQLIVTGQTTSIGAGDSETREITSYLFYDENGRVQVSGSPGRSDTVFQYDEDGNQHRTFVKWVDPSGAEKTTATETIYDDEGRVIETRQYAYDGFDTILAGRDFEWKTSTEYNDQGLVDKSIGRFGNENFNFYDATGNLIETRTRVKSEVAIDAMHAAGEYWLVSRTAYDELGRSYAVSDPFLMSGPDAGPLVLVTDTSDLRVSYTIYDKLGRVAESLRLAGVEIERVEDPDVAGDSMATFYTNEFDVSFPSSAILTSSSTAYRDDGLVYRTTSTIHGPESSEHTTWFVYDSSQRQTHTVQVIDINQDGNLEGVSPDGSIPNWDVANPAAEIVVNETRYDAYGRQELSINAAGFRETSDADKQVHATRSIYDGLGRVVESQVINPNPNPAPDSSDFRLSTFTSYDTAGRRSTATDVMGQVTQYGYGVGGVLQSVTLPAAYDAELDAVNAANYEYGYDNYGNQTSITDPRGGVTEFTYDHNGRQLTRTLPLGVNSNSFTEHMHYRDEGLDDLIGATPEASVGLGQLEYQVSFEGVVTAYRYDNTPTGGGRLVETHYYATVADYQTDLGSAGSAGLLDASDEQMRYIYDAFGRHVSVDFQRADGSTDTTTYEYDADGRQIQVASEEGVINYDYDAGGRHIRTQTDSGVTDTHYNYDDLGRLVSVGESDETYSDNNTRYFYDVVGNMDAVRLPAAIGGAVTTDYQYDTLNRLVQIDQFVDSDGDNSYNSGASEQFIESFVYNLRADGKRTGVLEARAKAVGPGVDETRIDWVYDEMGRLAIEAYDAADPGDDFWAVYRFDSSGNRISKNVDLSPDFSLLNDEAALADILAGDENDPTDRTTNYQFDANDRLYREVFQEAGVTTTSFYEYGEPAAAGSNGTKTQQTKKQTFNGLQTIAGNDATETVEYSYNLQGRQSEVVKFDDASNSTTSKYKFNVNGVRVEQIVGTETTTYLVDENNPTGYAQVLEEGDSNGDRLDAAEVDRSYTLGHDVISQTDNAATETQYLLYDGHGSTRALVDGTGTIKVVDPMNLAIRQVFDYDAYGNLLNMEASEAATSLLYSGEFTDAATGQQYLRGRFYDSSTGRFNRLDPFSGNVNDPQSLHKYLYGHGDPIGNVDPTGLFSVAGLSASIGNIGIQVGNVAGAAFRAYQVADRLHDIVGIAELVTGLSSGIPALRREVLKLVREIGAVAGPRFTSISTQDISDAFSQVARDLVPRIAPTIARTHAKRVTSALLSRERSFSKRDTLVVYAPTPSGFYRQDTKLVKVPGLRIAGMNVEIALGGGGGRLFGFGVAEAKKLRKNRPADSYQLFRVDWHRSTYQHPAPHARYFSTSSGLDLHWHVPENSSQARGRGGNSN